MLHLYNSLTKQKERFASIEPKKVGLYTCGPTVYNYAHIGNLRTYVFEDILRRVLQWHNYNVHHVMNITDVGHLTDDADTGEDKMEKGAKREGKSAWDIAAMYTAAFLKNMEDLHILPPTDLPKATDHIPEQIGMVEALIEKGYAYETNDGIYFDTSKLDDYGKLVDLDKQSLQAGARVDMGEKKNPHDFALWKWSGDTARQMEWDAFGKKGFPGWHIECSAMSVKYLGDHFDIHAGGVDHKPVHHTNEIAQTEAVTGTKPWVNYWLHGEFLLIGAGEKMAKSGDNFITLQTVKDRGIDPLAYRYFLLQAHYRKQLSFSWEALEAAQTGLHKLRRIVNNMDDTFVMDPTVTQAFTEALDDDLNTPEALAIIWKALKEKTIDVDGIIAVDKVLGLKLHHVEEEQEAITIPADVQALLDERAQARAHKDWQASDHLRDAIAAKGFVVKDTAEGQEVGKK